MTFVGWFDKILEFFGSYLILYLGAIASVSAEKDFDSSTWAKDCWRYGGKENLIEVIINRGHQQCYLEDGRVLRPDLDDDDDQQDNGQDHHQDDAWRNVVSKNSFCLSSRALLSWKKEGGWWYLLLMRSLDELLTVIWMAMTTMTTNDKKCEVHSDYAYDDNDTTGDVQWEEWTSSWQQVVWPWWLWIWLSGQRLGCVKWLRKWPANIVRWLWWLQQPMIRRVDELLTAGGLTLRVGAPSSS